MSDLFISYAQENQPQAERLAKALKGLGWSVWWRQEAPQGQLFNEEKEDQLSHAQGVIVIWSQYSVSDRWVNSVAQQAAARNVLLPVLFEDVYVPLDFRGIETANLIGWDGDANDAFFQDFAQKIQGHLSSAGAQETITEWTNLEGSNPSSIDPKGISGPTDIEDPDEELEVPSVEDPDLMESHEHALGEAVGDGIPNEEPLPEEVSDQWASEETSAIQKDTPTIEEHTTPFEPEAEIEEPQISSATEHQSAEEYSDIEEPEKDQSGELVDAPSTEPINTEQEAEIPAANEEAMALEEEDNYLEEELYQPEISDPESNTSKPPKYLIYGGLLAAALLVLWGIFKILPQNEDPSEQAQVVSAPTEERLSQSPPEVLESQSQAPATDPEPIDQEEEVWQSALEQNEIDGFENYKVNYPEGKYLAEAQRKIISLETQISTVKVLDQNENKVANTPAPKKASEGYASVSEGNFFTTDTVTKGPMKPGKQVQDFNAGDRVYLWATIKTPAYEKVRIEWLTANDKLISEKYVNVARDLVNGFNIHDWKRNFPGTTGQFKVRLYNSQGQKIAETRFTVN